MIGIKFIDSSNMRTFAERLEIFINEHPEAKILFGQIKGIEGGKGIFAILSYDKKEEIKIEPEPEVEEIIPEPEPIPTVDPEKEALKAQLKLAKDKLVTLEAVKELDKGENTEITIE